MTSEWWLPGRRRRIDRPCGRPHHFLRRLLREVAEAVVADPAMSPLSDFSRATDGLADAWMTIRAVPREESARRLSEAIDRLERADAIEWHEARAEAHAEEGLPLPAPESHEGKKAMSTEDAVAFLAEVGQRIRTQNGAEEGHGADHGTSSPVYTVDQVQTFGGDDWEDVPVIEEWVLVQGAVSLTREGIDEYLRLNGHNLDEPRVYVASLWQVPEMIRLREALMEISRQVERAGLREALMEISRQVERAEKIELSGPESHEERVSRLALFYPGPADRAAGRLLAHLLIQRRRIHERRSGRAPTS